MYLWIYHECACVYIHVPTKYGSYGSIAKSRIYMYANLFCRKGDRLFWYALPHRYRFVKHRRGLQTSLRRDVWRRLLTKCCYHRCVELWWIGIEMYGKFVLVCQVLDAYVSVFSLSSLEFACVCAFRIACCMCFPEYGWHFVKNVTWVRIFVACADTTAKTVYTRITLTFVSYFPVVSTILIFQYVKPLTIYYGVGCHCSQMVFAMR